MPKRALYVCEQIRHYESLIILLFRSAFFWFTNDEREKVTAQHPKISAGDLARELGRRWNEADAKTRLKYEAIAEDDQIGYERVTKLIFRFYTYT